MVKNSVKVILWFPQSPSPCTLLFLHEFFVFFDKSPSLTIHRIPPTIAAMSNDPALKTLDSMEEVWETFRPDLNEVEVQIQKQLDSKAPLINTVADHILSSGGKRIRPLLLILSARMFGFPEKEYLLLGSLIEFIHTATLLHDDVLDEANIRRGQKTARRIWGNQASILVGIISILKPWPLSRPSATMESMKCWRMPAEKWPREKSCNYAPTVSLI